MDIEDINPNARDINDNVLEYIKKELRKGYSKDSIKSRLVRAGHSPLSIDLHFNSLGKKIKKKPSFLFFLLIFFVVFLIISGILNIILYRKIPLQQRYEKLAFEARSLCTEGEYDKAVKKLEKAKEMDSNKSLAYAVYGYCYMSQGRYLEAVLMLTQAVKKSPTTPLHYYGLGIAYCKLGNYNLGIANLEKSIRLNPSAPEFHAAIADCYLKEGNNEEAAKHLAIINAANNSIAFNYTIH